MTQGQNQSRNKTSNTVLAWTTALLGTAILFFIIYLSHRVIRTYHQLSLYQEFQSALMAGLPPSSVLEDKHFSMLVPKGDDSIKKTSEVVMLAQKKKYERLHRLLNGKSYPRTLAKDKLLGQVKQVLALQAQSTEQTIDSEEILELRAAEQQLLTTARETLIFVLTPRQEDRDKQIYTYASKIAEQLGHPLPPLSTTL